ncbi:MAG TPA: choice-of-anchor D domain-containing protein [Candidatus Angelobacter sp.]|jgi:hypothetical protein|nr:choice-of-anchor D domain-containing protein [Candidatus Angelobacter sp.]
MRLRSELVAIVSLIYLPLMTLGSLPLAAQSASLAVSNSSLTFSAHNVGTSSAPQSVVLSNNGTTAVTFNRIVVSGSFSGDFTESDNCQSVITAGSSCTLTISFTPSGTGLRTASVLVIDNASNSPQTVTLAGTGAGTCTNISDCAYQVLNQRSSANQQAFFVYKDADSAFNHGFPSGLFGGKDVNLNAVVLNAACIDDPLSATGCSNDTSRLDGTRGTVFRITFPGLAADDFVGLNFLEPQNYDGITVTGNGYNLTPATALQFDVRSPDGATVQFGMGGCVTNFFTIGPSWTTLTVPINSLFPPPQGAFVCPPDSNSAHILFTVTTNGVREPSGKTVLLDNIQFVPVPARQAKDPQALSLPLGNQTYGVFPQAPPSSIPTDEANRNPAPIYEAAITMLALFNRHQAMDMVNALKIADALDYALHHDNHGDALPTAADGSIGLHNAYTGGDIALLNDQPFQNAQTPTGLAGDVRIAGFFVGPNTPCGTNGYCLVQDGATGGNNAFAIIALASAYLESGNPVYLKDAETIGNWISANLTDNSGKGYGGYFVGYGDSDPAKKLIPGKSVENNADIFAAFSYLTIIEASLGNTSAASLWTARAKVAGDFVIAMFDSVNGRFFAGTVAAGSKPDPAHGNCQTNLQKGNDVINVCDFLDSNSFTTLPMSGSVQYGKAIDWTRPIQYMLNLQPPLSFTQSIAANGVTFQGFDIVPAAPNTGVAWEFTGQMVEVCNYLDALLNINTFQTCAQTYLTQIATAQNSAPFGDGIGVVASIMQNGDTLTPIQQCLVTPFQCIPERTGLAATNWAIYADTKFNPLAFATATLSPKSIAFPGQLVGTTSSPVTITLTNLGIIPLTITGPIKIAGQNSGDFSIGTNNSCTNATVLAPGANCVVDVTFTPGSGGARSAMLVFTDTGIASPQNVPLSGTGLPLDDFAISIGPAQTVVAGGSAQYSVNTNTIRGQSQSVMLSASGLPSGTSASFSPNPILSGNSSTLTINTSVGATPVSQSINVTGTGTSAMHSAQAGLTIQPPLNLSPTVLVFASQGINTTSASQSVTVSNGGSATSAIKSIVLSGDFPGEYVQSNNCPASIAPGGNCTINITFTPLGTGTRTATLLVIDDAGNSPQTVLLTGVGVSACVNISDCAYNELSLRATDNQRSFFVYKDGDSGFNHGFPSGLFGSGVDLTQVTIDAACIDDPVSPSGCSTDTTRLDGSRGTVFRVTFPPLSSQQFVGLNFQEPKAFGKVNGNAYDLTPATAVQFDVRSPSPGTKVRFSVGGCVTNPPIILSQSWTTLKIDIKALISLDTTNCPPDLTKIHLLFGVQTSVDDSPNGATVLLDNIQFLPVPARQINNPAVLSLPVSTLTLGAFPSLTFPIPIDQATRNLSTVYESALTILSLLRRGHDSDVTNAGKIADALDYALHHDNNGDSVPAASDGSVGLHNAYSSGDLALVSDEAPDGVGLATEIRLAGFTADKSLCGATRFCLVLDGASGGSNAWAILALAATYLQTGNLKYLNDAETIGNWIVAKLSDSSATNFGGYFVGFADGGTPGVLLAGKSTEFNAAIFAAFSLLAQIEASRGNNTASAAWTNKANVAGDFVAGMFDSGKGRFFAGTVSSDVAGTIAPGVCANGSQKGNDVINTCDFLDADSLSILALSASSRFQSIDWTRPLNYILNLSSPGSLAQTVTAGGITFKGFTLLPAPANTGIGWEFTGQTATACNYLDDLLNATNFQACGQTYIAQLLQAQNLSPFADGTGVPGSVLQAGDTLPPISQCLATPFQCVAERPGLAATNWAIFSEQKFNPFTLVSVGLSPSTLSFPGQPLNTTSPPLSITITNNGTGTLKVTGVTITVSEFKKATDTCTAAPVAAGSSCTIGVTFTPLVAGNRNATLTINDNALGATQIIPLSGLGVQTFTLSVVNQGFGVWTVTSGDGSINCGSACSASFASGATVTLTASAGPASSFAGWGGACSGTQTCTVTMTTAQTVFATFTAGLRFVPVTPCRIADTRNANGPFGGPFLAGQTTRSFAVPSSACSIPSTAQAYSLNATVVPHGSLGFLTLFPCGTPLPNSSTLNSDGRIKASAAIVAAGTDGAVCVFPSNDTDLVLDIDGYFVPPTINANALAFFTMTPCRLVDTRNMAGPLGGPSLVGNATRTFPILSSPCNVPAAAKAYSLNYTSVPNGPLGFLTTWPAGQPQPLVSTLNSPTGVVTANAAIVPAGTNGDISVFVTNNSDLAIDIDGYFAPPATGGLSLFSLNPCRVLDTRNPPGSPPFNGKIDVNVVSSPCGASATAKAFVLNGTVVPPAGLGFLTLWPQGAPQPLVSTLNAVDGAVTSNLAIVPTTNGSISAFGANPTHLVLDISGFFAP